MHAEQREELFVSMVYMQKGVNELHHKYHFTFLHFLSFFLATVSYATLILTAFLNTHEKRVNALVNQALLF